jgi:hypothetical protein
MYRVVTKSRHMQGGRMKWSIDAGPWQPLEQWARQWADYLGSTGFYDRVEVESNVKSTPSDGMYQERQ